jgi:SAM-dependent MidA family methyltransferase
VQWRTELPDSVTGLLLAVELLDVVPVDVVELTGDGLRLVEVADTGAERLGATPTAEDFGWLRRWWPLTAIGDRAEVGAARDAMWRSLCDRIVLGSAVAVDYESVPHRAPAGTLSGYRAGHQVAPVPDGSCDITAHVRFDSLRGPDDVQLAQRDALRQLGVRSNLPEYDGDAAAYLAGLSSAGAVAGLLDPAGLGGFMWLVHSVGTAPPLSADVADREPARPQSKPARRTSAHTSPTRR